MRRDAYQGSMTGPFDWDPDEDPHQWESVQRAVSVEELLDRPRPVDHRDRLRGLIYHAARLFEELEIDPLEYLSEQIHRQYGDDRLLVLELGGKLGQFGKDVRSGLGKMADKAQRGLLKGAQRASRVGADWQGNAVAKRNANKQKGKLSGEQYFSIAVGAMKHLLQMYGPRGYVVSMGGKKVRIDQFLGNIIKGLSTIRDNMPAVEKKHEGLGKVEDWQKSEIYWKFHDGTDSVSMLANEYGLPRDVVRAITHGPKQRRPQPAEKTERDLFDDL